MPKFGKKVNEVPILAIAGGLLLLFGIISSPLQFSNNINNNAYAQEVDLGPFVTIGPPNRSETLDSFSDGRIIYVAYEAQGENNVYLGLLESGPGGRGEVLQDVPENVIPGGSDPSIVVAPGGRIYIVAERPGVGDIAFVECAGDDDSCEAPQSISTGPVEPEPEPEPVEGEGSSDSNSCEDGIDNDGDGDIDLDDADCQSEGGGLCSDGIDNDGDGEMDSDDSDCFTVEPDFASFDGNSPTAVMQPILYPNTSPQLRFVTAGGGDDINRQLTAPRIDQSDSALNEAEQRGANVDSQQISRRACLPTDTGGRGGSTPSNAEIATSSDGSDIYVVWEQDGDVMFRASHDGGETFGEILNLSNNAGASVDPRVATSSNGQFIHVTWQDNTPGNEEIFYSRSTDGGETFNGGSPVGTPTNLSNTPQASFDHQLVTEGTNVYVVWVDCTTDNGDIYFRKSNNNGESFSDINNLSAGNPLIHTSRDPDMAAQGSLVSVVWTVYGTESGLGEIIFRESTNNGNSFGFFVLVSNTPGTDSKEPQVDYTPEDDERYVAWHDQGGPERVNTAEGVYNVLAAASDDGISFSAPVNLSDAPNNPDREKQTSQLQIVDDVAVWDPSGRRG